MEKLILNVEGMICFYCEVCVIKVLLEVNGVKSVVVLFDEGIVIVEFEKG